MVYIILYYSGEKPVKRSVEKGVTEDEETRKLLQLCPDRIQCPCTVNKRTFDIRPGRETGDAPVVK